MIAGLFICAILMLVGIVAIVNAIDNRFRENGIDLGNIIKPFLESAFGLVCLLQLVAIVVLPVLLLVRWLIS